MDSINSPQVENLTTKNTKSTEKKSRERYEVEWCTDPYFDECGDIVPDRCTYNQFYFANLRSAIKFAERICIDCYFGCAQIRKQYYSVEMKDWLPDPDFELIEIS